MRRIVVELPLTIVAACLIAALVWVAGSAIMPSLPPVALAYTPQPALCTPSYCEPSEVPIIEGGSPMPGSPNTGTAEEAH